MKRSYILRAAIICIAALVSTSPNAEVIVYDFSGIVTDAGIIAGVSASPGDTVTGQFAYDTSTPDSEPTDITVGGYIDFDITPPLGITLPNGSITFDSFTTVYVNTAWGINVIAGVPDPTFAGSNIDIDIEFPLKPGSTALATDALPTNIDLNDFSSVEGAFSSFSPASGPVGDPIFFSINSLSIASAPPTETVMPAHYLAAGSPGDTWAYERLDASQFIWALSAITTGTHDGRMKIGNSSEWVVYDVVNDIFTIYETQNGAINPPLAIPATAQTNQVINMAGQELVLLTAPSVTVQAGTFSDILVLAWLDSGFGPNGINTQLGIDPGIAAAVTDVDWYAAGVGHVKNMGVDAATGSIDGGFGLVSTEPPSASTFYYSGTLMHIFEDDGTGTHTGAKAGDSYYGKFSAGSAVSDGMRILPCLNDECEYEFLGAPISTSLSDGGITETGTGSLIAILNQYDLEVDDAAFLNVLPGISWPVGTLLDSWGGDSWLDGGTRLYLGFFSLDTNLYSSLEYQSSPPDLANTDLAVFTIEETGADGNPTFLALGILDAISDTPVTAHTAPPVTPWLQLLLK